MQIIMDIGLISNKLYSKWQLTIVAVQKAKNVEMPIYNKTATL